MPSIPTSSRRDTFQTSIPSTSYSTPTSAARLSRAFSPPVSSTSYTPTVTPLGAQQKLNVVSKVAIEGKAKQDQDGVGIKMYLKISVPLDSVSPGSTIQLFPEENVKILTSQVHPLDSLSVPYNFSSTVSPLLHNAARALGLPARSQQTFHSAFNLSPPSTSASLVSTRSSKMNGSASTSSEAVPVVDSTYTGHILVSGYHISYVLPKVFPPPQPYDESSISRRRSSIGEKHHIHFMAAIDMWVPYLSRPPRSPYLLSIPTPRCLHNNIKVRIFPPTTTTSSFASLSSTDEDGTSWDLASDPHVTRSSNPSRRARANSYSTFADDESSDSSTAGFSYGCGIQGSFPSAERIRIRWAKPLKTIGLGEGEDGQKDGRRRVGVKSVKGEMTCVVRGLARNTEAEGFAGGGGGGVIMDVEYKGTCKGIWFPGVATLLGMDVGLEAKNSDVEWVNAGAGLEGYSNEWEVSGGSGYTGFDVGAGSAEAQKQTLGRYDSLDSNSGTPEIFVSPSSPAPGIASSNTAGFPRSSGSGLSARNDSTSSTASSTSSLLRAPLPAPNVADYSFEGSASGSSSQASSMLSSFPGSASILTQSTDTQRRRAPGYPITLHLNMNELIPPAKNTFTFTISGTIIVTPRPNQNSIFKINSSTSRNSSEGEVDAGVKEGDLFTLPKFTVLAADSESTSVVIKNEMNDATIEVYETSSRSRNVDEHTKTATLQKGAFTKCSENGSPRVLVKSVRTPTGGAGVNGHGYVNGKSLFPSKRPRTPSGSAGTASRSSSPIGGHRLSSVPSLSTLKKGMGVAAIPMRPKRDGPLIIPWVDSIVTPLPSTDSGGSNDGLPDAYAVRIRLPAPADTDSEWLEFGLAKPGSASDDEKHRPPRVDIVNVSVEGVPVRFETSAAAKPDPPSGDVVDLRAVEFEQMSGKEWISWIRVHIGSGGGGSEVVVDYVANVLENTESGKKKGKRKARDEVSMEVYLPWFSLPVGRMEVVVEDMPGLDVFSMNTNFRHSSPTTSGNPAMNLRRLLQYSTEAFFYPHLSFRVRLDSAGSRLFSSSSSTQKYITLLLLFMMISTLPALFEIRTNVSHLSKSLEGYSLLSGAGWNDSPEPVTITTTVFTGTGTKWWFGESVTAVAEKGPSSTDAVPISSITSPPIPTIPIPHSHPSPASSDSFVSENSLSSRSPASFVEEYALIHIQKVIDFKWEDMKPVMKKATRVMQETVGVLWKVVSWVWYG